MRLIPQGHLARRFAWLLSCRCTTRCCLRPRGVNFALVDIALVVWPVPWNERIGTSQTWDFSGLCVRFRATPFTSSYSLLLLLTSRPLWAFTTGRLTIPYPGRLKRFDASSSSAGNHCQVTHSQLRIPYSFAAGDQGPVDTNWTTDRSLPNGSEAKLDDGRRVWTDLGTPRTSIAIGGCSTPGS